MPPVINSLQHLTLVKITLELCKNPSVALEMSRRPATNINEILFAVARVVSSMDIALLFKRKLLRCFVSIIFEFQNFVKSYSDLKNEIEYFPTVCWKSSGMIDRQKSLESLVRNPDIAINLRFNFACKYCLKEDILSLWDEIPNRDKNSLTLMCRAKNDWIFWLWKGDNTDWPRSSEDVYFQIIFKKSLRNSAAMYNLLKMLKPEERHRHLLEYLEKRPVIRTDINFYFELDDHQQSEVFQKYHSDVLISCCHWTLHSDFMDFADKFYSLIDEAMFPFVVANLFKKMYLSWGDLSYVNLIKEFWHASPVHLREALKKNERFYEKVTKVMDGSYEATINSAFETLDSWLVDPSLINTEVPIFVKPSPPHLQARRS
ncbi:uncharacterized protein CDAR_192941 [Caerostris darwini]|uniref:Uncharacterized protein n=1 Tax=Caerostris darwini TaxID=1538125 RepID=A0AAV4S1N4_9ARAC|nr:uncharacterized protein CDAR_192941 [Caerostris darwini]